MRFGFARQGGGDDAAEPERVVGEVAVGGGVCSRSQVRLAVHDRDDREHDVEALDALGAFWDADRDARRPDLALCARDPLRGRGLGRERRPSDLARRQAADGAERERELGIRRERRVAAAEQQREPLIVLGRRGAPTVLDEQGHPLPEPLLAPQRGRARCAAPPG